MACRLHVEMTIRYGLLLLGCLALVKQRSEVRFLKVVYIGFVTGCVLMC